jgi:hypothetical protein
MRVIFTAALCLILLANPLLSQNSISGIVSYANAASTPMTSVINPTTVYLYAGSTTTIAYQTNTGPFGTYSFSNIIPGTYTLKANTTKPPGGLNAGAALLVLLNFIGINSLTPLQLMVADVNGSGGIPNAADALAISRGFVGAIPNFLPPNVPAPGGPMWYSEHFLMTVTANSNVVQDLKMCCAGDLLGSYTPPP